jgi:hypothetical protein
MISFSFFKWWITLINFQVLNQSCIHGINIIQSSFTFLPIVGVNLIKFWLDFLLLSSWDILGCTFFFFRDIFMRFWYHTMLVSYNKLRCISSDLIIWKSCVEIILLFLKYLVELNNETIWSGVYFMGRFYKCNYLRRHETSQVTYFFLNELWEFVSLNKCTFHIGY